jgi:hypothetical protein
MLGSLSECLFLARYELKYRMMLTQSLSRPSVRDETSGTTAVMLCQSSPQMGFVCTREQFAIG